jgi:hypothetical protein
VTNKKMKLAQMMRAAGGQTVQPAKRCTACFSGVREDSDTISPVITPS